MATTLGTPDQTKPAPLPTGQLPPGIQPYTGGTVNAAAPALDPSQTSPAASTGMIPYAGSPMNSVASPPTGGPTPVSSIPMPPPPPAPTAPGTFDAGSNLINQQLGPSAVTAQAPNTNFGTGAISAGAPIQTNYGTGAVAPTATAPTFNDPQQQQLMGQLNGAIGNLTTGPDRSALAQQQLQNFDIAGQPQLAADFRNVGQQAAKFGRMGAGMTTNDLTGVLGTYQRNKMLLQNQLAADTANGTIQDRFNTVGALSGAYGQQAGINSNNNAQTANYQNQLFGQGQYNQGAAFDRAQAGVGQQNQNQNYATNVAQYNQGANFDRQQAANNANTNYQNQLFGQNQANTAQQTQQQQYQYGLSQDAQNAQIQQKMLEDQLLNSAQGRALNQYNAGNANDPTGMLQNFAGNQDATSAALFGSGADLFKNLGQTTAPQSQAPDYQAMFQQWMKSQQPPAGG